MRQRIDVDQALTDTWSPDPRTRIRALHELCPCQLKANYPQIWDRILEMVSDDDPKVRGHVLHVLGDGSPGGARPRLCRRWSACRPWPRRDRSPARRGRPGSSASPCR